MVWLQIIWSQLDLIRSQVQSRLQIIWSQNSDYCGLERLVLWVATVTFNFSVRGKALVLGEVGVVGVGIET